jgi:hypothetical protein
MGGFTGGLPGFFYIYLVVYIVLYIRFLRVQRGMEFISGLIN